MGRLIVIEGIDGSGKATQTALLERRLEELGERPIRISFPDYGSESSALVRMYLAGEIGQSAQDVNAFAASSFYSVDRYVSFKKHWEREYKSGRLFVADRYTTSNLTHQMEKQPRERWDAFIDWLCDFEYEKLRLPRPDLVIYLDMHPKVSAKLMDKRYGGDNNKKDIHERDGEYLLRCREGALYAARRLGWQVIRCFDEREMQPMAVETIATQVAQRVDELLQPE